MTELDRPFKVASVQAAPVFLNREASVEKACTLIAQAGREGARLIVFPEAYIPAYPDWVWQVPAGEATVYNELYAALVANAVTLPSPATDRLCQAAKTTGAYVVIGISERNTEASQASLYNTILYIDPQGQIIGKHRKLVPTAGERMVWTGGDGSTLDVYETPLGRLGGLICWENYMPLARFALYAWGVQIYLAPTWDHGEPWLSTIRHIAKEGRVYVISSCMILRTSDIPDLLPFKKRFYTGHDEWINHGDSAIVNPEGEIIAGPCHDQEEIIYAQIEPGLMSGPRWMLDVAGHYARPDVFQLTVNKTARQMVEVEFVSPTIVPPVGKVT